MLDVSPTLMFIARPYQDTGIDKKLFSVFSMNTQ